jgi:hypothetical protein
LFCQYLAFYLGVQKVTLLPKMKMYVCIDTASHATYTRGTARAASYG